MTNNRVFGLLLVGTSFQSDGCMYRKVSDTLAVKTRTTTSHVAFSPLTEVSVPCWRVFGLGGWWYIHRPKKLSLRIGPVGHHRVDWHERAQRMCRRHNAGLSLYVFVTPRRFRPPVVAPNCSVQRVRAALAQCRESGVTFDRDVVARMQAQDSPVTSTVTRHTPEATKMAAWSDRLAELERGFAEHRLPEALFGVVAPDWGPLKAEVK